MFQSIHRKLNCEGHNNGFNEDMREKPKPLTERRCEVMERDVILCFFVIRRLVELSRVSRLTIDFQFDVFSCPFNGRNMSPIDRHGIEKSYHLENELAVSKKMLYRGCPANMNRARMHTICGESNDVTIPYVVCHRTKIGFAGQTLYCKSIYSFIFVFDGNRSNKKLGFVLCRK